MRKSIFISFLIYLFTFSLHLCYAQDGRLESEYKLDVPKQDAEELWLFVQSKYGKDNFIENDLELSGEESIEVFIDQYFDLADLSLAEAEVSLRHRKRYKDNVLLKELIQLKTPFSEDKVVRNEIKFEVDENKRYNDLSVRHPFLKLLGRTDTERMSFHLAPFKIRPEDIQESIKLKQIRSRIYIKDQTGESVATITLDKVNNFSFPYQEYTEVELELNEIRYTLADEQERAKMNALNEDIKNKLSQKFPNLKVDQRSKYRKMKELKDGDILSTLYENLMWICFGSIVGLSSVLFIKDQLS